ncbi:uncharacterized protein LOC135093910 [Scylla paramamosain]|uniref:uncharacterized protein LOC135093910 n=1 Tax=Scylla paramamosain TaxID=85552 RepID=UPI003083A392
MRNVTKLRGTQIYINEDLCPASQEIKKSQIPKLEQTKSEDKVAYFRHTKLITKDKTIGSSVGVSGSRSSTDPSGAMECAMGGGAGTTFANVAESRTAGESSHGASDGSAGVADVRDRDTVVRTVDTPCVSAEAVLVDGDRPVRESRPRDSPSTQQQDALNKRASRRRVPTEQNK